ncbi:hypothetical protein [Vibrio phage D4]|nr:hypothetical protein vBVcaS_HC053 [Vibrio phage vB_VcaS_HC]UHD87310.1 hypothetical protein [Vibrio phage D4]WKV32810.1 hypothetical protein R21Y_49 [Vibrio phage vB_VhaS_R21Y]
MKQITEIRQQLHQSAGLISTAASLIDAEQPEQRAALEAAARELNTLHLDLSHYTFAEATTHTLKALDLIPSWGDLRKNKNGQQVFAICKNVTANLK